MIARECNIIYKGMIVFRRGSSIFLKNMCLSLIRTITNSTPYENILKFIRNELIPLVRSHVL